MEVADKGPLFIIYAYDDVAELQNELCYSRSAWQEGCVELQGLGLQPVAAGQRGRGSPGKRGGQE